MVDRHEEFRTWSLLAAISPEPSVRAGAEYALALFRDYDALAAACEVHKHDAMREIAEANELAAKCDALAADLTSMQMAFEAAHEQAHEMRERAIAAEARLAEAERTRANELAYVAEACIVATSQRDSHEARSHILDLRAWARSRASVPPYGAEIAASSAPAAQEGGK